MEEFPEIPGYKIRRKLGEGGMATVYLAVQESLERDVALKVMNTALAADKTFCERFLNEGKIVARVSKHPDIVTIHDIGCAGSMYYMAMEYIEGGSLEDRMRGTLSVAQIADIVRHIASALGYAHENGFVHRDVKPANVLFREDGAAMLTDFGIAKSTDSGKQLTQTGYSLGTPQYMSLEQMLGKTLDGRSDLYSLGLLFHELLTGDRPARGSEQSVAALPTEAEAYRPVLEKLLASDPDARYENAQALINALDAAKISSAATVIKPHAASAGANPDGNAGGTAKTVQKAGSPLKWVLWPGFAVLVVAVVAVAYYWRTQNGGVDADSKEMASINNQIASLRALRYLADGLGIEKGDTHYVTAVRALARFESAASDGNVQSARTAADEVEQAFSRAIRVSPRRFLKGSTAKEIRAALELCNQYVDACEEEWYATEAASEITLEPFDIDLSEVTNREFAQFVNATGYVTEAETQGFSYLWDGKASWKAKGVSWKAPTGRSSSWADQADYPVAHVSFNDAEAYCNWRGARLPTDAEWEYAARGPERFQFPWGNQWRDGELLWSQDTVPSKNRPARSFRPAVSGAKGFDFAGSVWEWVEDSRTGKRILKGGSYLESNPANFRSAAWRENPPARTHSDDGFRCAKTTREWPEKFVREF